MKSFIIIIKAIDFILCNPAKREGKKVTILVFEVTPFIIQTVTMIVHVTLRSEAFFLFDIKRGEVHLEKMTSNARYI